LCFKVNVSDTKEDTLLKKSVRSLEFNLIIKKFLVWLIELRRKSYLLIKVKLKQEIKVVLIFFVIALLET
jgi:hypothetical protein